MLNAASGERRTRPTRRLASRDHRNAGACTRPRAARSPPAPIRTPADGAWPRACRGGSHDHHRARRRRTLVHRGARNDPRRAVRHARGLAGHRRGRRHPPARSRISADILLLDIQMPTLDGLAATQQLITRRDGAARSSSSPPSTPTNTCSPPSSPGHQASSSRTPPPMTSSPRSGPSTTATPSSHPAPPADSSRRSGSAREAHAADAVTVPTSASRTNSRPRERDILALVATGPDQSRDLRRTMAHHAHHQDPHRQPPRQDPIPRPRTACPLRAARRHRRTHVGARGERIRGAGHRVLS